MRALSIFSAADFSKFDMYVILLYASRKRRVVESEEFPWILICNVFALFGSENRSAQVSQRRAISFYVFSYCVILVLHDFNNTIKYNISNITMLFRFHNFTDIFKCILSAYCVFYLCYGVSYDKCVIRDFSKGKISEH